MAGPFTGNPFAGQFGYFQAAVNDPVVRSQPGGVQQYVWGALTNHYASRGETLPPGGLAAVNQLLSLAGQMRRASGELSGALATHQGTGFDQAITGSMISSHLDARPLSEQKLGRQYRAVYLSQEIVEGEPVLSYRTHDFGSDLPQSTSALQDEIEAAAQVSAADYGYDWGGVATPVSILSY